MYMYVHVCTVDGTFDVMVYEYLTTLIVKVYETLHTIETGFVT